MLYMVRYIPDNVGCPVVLKGKLNKPWAWNAFDPDLSNAEFEVGYVYEAKHKFLNFDYWDLNWMASEQFVEICRKFDVGVDAVPVDVVLSDGASSVKKYFYLRWSAWASVIDLDRSRYELEKDLATGEVLYQKYFPDAPVLESIESFVVDEKKVPGSAAFLCLDLGHTLVCNALFRAACEDAGLQGMGFEEITSYTKSDFWD